MNTAENRQTEIITMRDGARISVQRYAKQGSKPFAVVQAVHGFGEHGGRYRELGEFFAANGVAFVVHDQRGHGQREWLSDGQRLRDSGIAPSYDSFLDDLKTLRGRIGEWFADTPAVLYGHSMGGNIALNYLLKRGQTEYAAAILETPWLRLYKQKPAALIALAKLLGALSAKPAVTDKLDYGDITRDKEIIEDFKKDIYYHNRLSLRLFTQISGAGEYALQNADRLTIPTLLLRAGRDKIVCPRAAGELLEKSGGRITDIEFAEGSHSLHNDLCRDEVKAAMLKFVMEISGGLAASQK